MTLRTIDNTQTPSSVHPREDKSSGLSSVIAKIQSLVGSILYHVGGGARAEKKLKELSMPTLRMVGDRGMVGEYNSALVNYVKAAKKIIYSVKICQEKVKKQFAQDKATCLRERYKILEESYPPRGGVVSSKLLDLNVELHVLDAWEKITS